MSLLYVSLLICSVTYSQHWEGIGIENSGMGTTYKCLYADTISNLLYVGGFRVVADGISYRGITAWDGTSFYSLGNSANNLYGSFFTDLQAQVWGIRRYKNEIYAGGGFLLAGSDTVNNIARWDGTNWHKVGQGIEGVVRCFYEMDDTLYVGGSIDAIIGSNIQCKSLVKWDGTSWHEMEPMPLPYVSSISSMVEYKDELYVAGNFGGLTDTLNEIARWDGTQWLSVGGGIWGDSWVESLVVYKGYLYAGGYFFEQDGNAGSFIMRWNGEEWSEVGGGVSSTYPQANGQIHGMGIFNDELWVGGAFKYAGDIPAKYIAKWDGEKWCSMEDDLHTAILGFEVYNNELYMMGGNSLFNSTNIPYVAKWTGGNYVDTCSTPTNIVEITQEDNEIFIFPNPATTTLNIRIPNSSANSYQLQNVEIYNLSGQIVLTKKIKVFGNTYSINISTLPVGSYFVRVFGEENVWAEKFVVVKNN